MNKEMCFKIDSNELFLEQVLVEYNKIPIYFVCKDENQVYYIVLCIDIDEEKYIIVKTEIESLINLFRHKITMRDIILVADKYWEVTAGNDICNDICIQFDIEKINKDDLPLGNSYFKVLSKTHQTYFDELENIVMSDDREWNMIDTLENNSISELEFQSIHEKINVYDYIEINDFKITSSFSLKSKSFEAINQLDFKNNIHDNNVIKQSIRLIAS